MLAGKRGPDFIYASGPFRLQNLPLRKLSGSYHSGGILTENHTRRVSFRSVERDPNTLPNVSILCNKAVS